MSLLRGTYCSRDAHDDGEAMTEKDESAISLLGDATAAGFGGDGSASRGYDRRADCLPDDRGDRRRL